MDTVIVRRLQGCLDDILAGFEERGFRPSTDARIPSVAAQTLFLHHREPNDAATIDRHFGDERFVRHPVAEDFVRDDGRPFAAVEREFQLSIDAVGGRFGELNFDVRFASFRIGEVKISPLLVRVAFVEVEENLLVARCGQTQQYGENAGSEHRGNLGDE